MNCLFLLVLLGCCNGFGGRGNCCQGRVRPGSCGCERRQERENCDCERRQERENCDCERRQERENCGCERRQEQENCGCERRQERENCGCERRVEQDCGYDRRFAESRPSRYDDGCAYGDVIPEMRR